jgi:ATP-binding cassette subfamily F protein uup
MILLDAVELTVSRPDRDLFRDVSITVRRGDRIGVVGINGTGKSTLLRVLAGSRTPDRGQVRFGRGVTVSVLDQEAALPSGLVIEAVVPGGADSPDGDPDQGRWEAEAVLDRLGMGNHLRRPTGSLSGGEAKRVALARALLQPADLLILDEPTNHLDLDTIDWLQNRLLGHRGGLLLVTHDRHLLDAVTNRIIELDRGRWYSHQGGYARYLEDRDRRQVDANTAEAVRRNLARTELAWLRRGAPARTSKPRARLERARELVDGRPEGPARPAELHLEFGRSRTPRLGDVVIELEGGSLATPDGRTLFEELDLRLDPRERLGIVGPNGAGKTSLLDVLAGRAAPDRGRVTVGSTVVLGYYDQTGTELDPEARVREVVAGPHRKPDWTDARLLEAFWFDTDTQWAQVGTLSGGERRRLQLLTVLAGRPNVLFLDEPTNDLDLETLRALEDFLEDWPGAVVAVSHDRAFLERVVSEALVIDGTGFAGRWPGGFGVWDQQRRQRLAKRDTIRAVGSDARGRTGRDERPRSVVGRSGADTGRSGGGSGRSASTIGHLLRESEKAMKKLEKRKVELEAELNHLIGGGSGDHEALASVGGELARVSAELQQREDEWLELADEQEQR